MIIRGINDQSEERHFATESSGVLFGDCPCGAPVARPVPVRDPLKARAKQIVLKEFYDLKDKLDFFDFTRNREMLDTLYLKTQFLCDEVNNGFLTTIKDLELDAVEAAESTPVEDVGEEQVYEVDVLDLFSPSTRKLGIQMTSLDGWRPHG